VGSPAAFPGAFRDSRLLKKISMRVIQAIEAVLQLHKWACPGSADYQAYLFFPSHLLFRFKYLIILVIDC